MSAVNGAPRSCNLVFSRAKPDRSLLTTLDLILPFNSTAQSSLRLETSIPTNADMTCVAVFIVLTFLVCRLWHRCAGLSYRSVCDKREMSRGIYLTHRLDPARGWPKVSPMSPDSACSITPESLLPGLSRSAGEGYEVSGFTGFPHLPK